MCQTEDLNATFISVPGKVTTLFVNLFIKKSIIVDRSAVYFAQKFKHLEILGEDRSMNSDLVLSVQWNWGSPKIVRVRSTDILSDVLTSNGFIPMEGFRLFVVNRGRLLDEGFSLQFHEITTGDHLVCVLKRLPSKDKSRRFLESLTPARRVVCQTTPIADAAEADRRSEQARLNDISFAGWESLPALRVVMNDLLREQEEHDHGKLSDEDIYPTNLAESQGMGETPLPNLFHTDCMPANGIFKNGYEWSSRYVKDIPDQAKRGNFFDHLKK
jgi:hypothetical protein